MQSPWVHLNLSLSRFKPAAHLWFSDSCTRQKPGDHPYTSFPLLSPPKSSLPRSSVALAPQFPLNSSFLSPSPLGHMLPPSCQDHCSNLPGSVSVPLWFVYSPIASVIFRHANLNLLLYFKPFNGFPWTLK